MTLELIALIVGAVGLGVGLLGFRTARTWRRDCRQCRIIIARKSRVVLDAPLTEWLAWNKALPNREQSRGGIIFRESGISVALARPKIGAAAAKTKTRIVADAAAPKRNRSAHRAAAKTADATTAGYAPK